MAKTEQDFLWGNLSSAQGGALSGIADRNLEMEIDGKKETMNAAAYLDAVSHRAKERIHVAEVKAEREHRNKLITYAVAAGIGLIVLGRII